MLVTCVSVCTQKYNHLHVPEKVNIQLDFSTFKLLVGHQEGCVACKNICSSYPKGFPLEHKASLGVTPKTKAS